MVGEEAGEVKDQVACGAFSPCIKIGKGEAFVFTGPAIVDSGYGIPNQKAGVTVHFTYDDRVPRFVSPWVFPANVAHPEQFTA